jgi:hypothetical protein
MEIEFIENEDLSETIPTWMMDSELKKIAGNKVILQWFLAEAVETKFEDQFGVLYQEVAINQIESFSVELNSTFFERIANEYEFQNNLEKKLYLFFKLKPIPPPKQNSRISWWERNIICTELQNGQWKISGKKIWFMSEMYANIIKHGQITIKDAS